MRILTVVRHAKAQAESPGSRDFDRSLTSRGEKDVKRMAKLLAKAEPPVDLIVSSPARRAAQSAKIIAARLDCAHPILWRDEIYNEKAITLLAVLESLPEDAQHITIVGHNPGMAGLVAGLSSGDSHQLNVRMPPGSMATLQLEIYWWNQIRWGCGQLQMLMNPKLMRGK